MQGKSSTKESFVRQAGILAAAGIICRIIGVLYRSPLTRIIGAEGNGYYSTAYTMYTMILLIASYSIPSALAKVISQELALGKNRNANRIFKCAIAYVIAVGGIGSIFTYACAELLADDAANVLRVFVPTIFLSGLVGVLRGYFQGRRSMMQTSVSQILEQIANAIFSVGMAYVFMQYLAGDSVKSKALYGAAGSAVGTGAGVLTAFIYMYICYKKNKRNELETIGMDSSGTVDSYRSIFKMILFVVTPYILSTFIYNFSTPVNQIIYIKYMKYFREVDSSLSSQLYGVFSGESLVVINVPVALATAMAAAIIPSISAAIAKEDVSDAKRKMDKAIKVTMLIAIPCAVGLMVLARPVMILMFSPAEKLKMMPGMTTIDLASKLIVYLGITVIFTSLSTLNNAFMQAMGKPWRAMINAAIAMVIQTVVFIIMLVEIDSSVYSFVASSIVYSLSMCILNEYTINKELNFKQKILDSYILPAIASVLMGCATLAVYKVVAYATGNEIALVASFCVAIAVYFVFIILLGAAKENDLASLPAGRKLVVIAKKLKLLR